MSREQSEVRAILVVLIAITIWAGWMSATRLAITGGKRGLIAVRQALPHLPVVCIALLAYHSLPMRL
jgi:hypothetical protein